MTTAIITFGNNKGGTGKTFLSKLFAEFIARKNHKTLLIDLDPQTNLSRRFVEMTYETDGHLTEFVPPVHPDFTSDPDWPSGRSSSADIWLSEFTVTYPTYLPTLDIIPGDSAKLQRVEMITEENVFSQVLDRMNRFLRMTGIYDLYQFIIIDTRPSKGPLTSAALFGSTHLFIPSEMEVPSIEGLVGLIGLTHELNEGRPQNDQLSIGGIIPNKIRMNTIIHKEHLNALKNDPLIAPFMLSHYLSDRVGYKESMMLGAQSVFDLPKKNKLRQEAENLCHEILSKVTA